LYTEFANCQEYTVFIKAKQRKQEIEQMLDTGQDVTIITKARELRRKTS
jgi:hypothetical protein